MGDTETRGVLVVFAKAPVAGKVKTRLTDAISPEDAAALYQAFLTDSLRQYEQLAEIRLYTPETDQGHEYFQSQNRNVHAQTGSDLGTRMRNAIRESFEAGFQRVVIIGTDHPTLPSSYIQSAFSELEAPETVVIGPSLDGGYYLLGQSVFSPHLFDGMTYSHSEVFDQTVDRAVLGGHRLTVLPEWYDVDDKATLRRLYSELGAGLASDEPRSTRIALTEIAARYPKLFENKQDD